jgi:hypothetical protein
MKLDSILDQINLRQEPTSMDLDVSIRLGPTISQHLTALEALCKLLPNCAELQEKLNEIKGLFASSVPLQSNVLEAYSKREDYPVVYEYDPENPIEKQRLAVIGGAGSYTLESLDSKVRAETAELSRRVDGIRDVGDYSDREHLYRNAQYLASILENHLLTLAVGIKQIAQKSNSDKMSETSAVNHGIELDHVMAMYETMKPGMGDRAWVAITKRLRAEGHDPAIIEMMINRAIILKGS